MKFNITSLLKNTLEAIFIGLCVGLLISIYQFISDLVIKYSNEFYTTDSNTTFILFIILVLLLSVVIFIINRYKDINGSGVPQYELMIHKGYNIKWYKALPLMFISSIYTYFLGAGLGSEGPSVFLGGMIGSGSNKVFKEDDKGNIAVGGGIGFGCAFSSLLGGIVYTFEESLNNCFSLRLVYKSIIGGITAYFIKSLVYNHRMIHFENINTLPFDKYYLLILVSISVFIVGFLFQKCILILKDFFKKHKDNILVKYKFYIVVILTVIISIFYNEYNGGGMKIMNNLFSYTNISLLLLILVFRLIYSSVSANSGLSGGLLIPMFILGAIASSIIYQLFQMNQLLSESYFQVLILCGMLGLFANVTKSPLTASALALTFTNFTLAVIPVIFTILITYLLGRLFKTHDIYEDLIERL